MGLQHEIERKDREIAKMKAMLEELSKSVSPEVLAKLQQGQ